MCVGVCSYVRARVCVCVCVLCVCVCVRKSGPPENVISGEPRSGVTHNPLESIPCRETLRMALMATPTAALICRAAPALVMVDAEARRPRCFEPFPLLELSCLST